MAYRKRRSTASSLLKDTSYIANRLSWEGCVFLGIIGFSIFYFIIPIWLQSELDSLQGNMFRPMVEAILGRRIHWVQWVGIAIGLICVFFAVRNYFESEQLGQYGERKVSFFSRILAKFVD